jgi:hypothetical protein
MVNLMKVLLKMVQHYKWYVVQNGTLQNSTVAKWKILQSSVQDGTLQ